MTTRVAVVTGAASGIGFATAALLAKKHHVVLWDLEATALANATNEIHTTAGDVAATAVDVTDRPSIDSAVDDIRERYGRLDILVNAAGIANFRPFEELEESEWDHMMAVNAKGVFSATQAATPLMRKHQYGRVVSVSSLGAYSGSPSHSHYAASKAAVVGFSKALCKELGPDGITVNCVAPGVIDTPMIGQMSEEARQRYADNPVGRIGTPLDVAHAIDYLSSEVAGYVTGWVVSMNGGMYT